jgi:hypothetical protein
MPAAKGARELCREAARRGDRSGINSCGHGDGFYSGAYVKRPVCKQSGACGALVLALCAAGCSGVNTRVPITPLMFMQHPASQPAPAGQPVTLLAVNLAPPINP